MSQASRRIGAMLVTQMAVRRTATFTQHVRTMANRFNRRAPTSSSGSSSAVATRPSSDVGAPLAGVTIEGADAQVAAVRLRPNQSFKVDPSAIISVPQGIEVRAVLGAPQQEQPQMQYQQQQQQQPSGVGGLLSRLRNAPSPQQQQMQQAAPSAPMLAELALQPGHSMPAESVQLGPATAAKLHTLSLDEYGGEMYISRGSFLAAPSSVNIHNVDEPTGIPGLFLQRVDGVGSVVLKVSGQAMAHELAPGEQMYAQANRLVAVESTVQVLGGQGLLVTIVGPGRVLLQSLPSLEVALYQQAESTASALQAAGVAPAAGAMTPFSPMGMGGGLGSMMLQGAAFGVGSSIAHSAINSMMGGGHGTAAATPAPEAPSQPEQSFSDAPDSGSDGGDGGGSFFGSMFGGDEDGGDDGGDSDW